MAVPGGGYQVPRLHAPFMREVGKQLRGGGVLKGEWSQSPCAVPGEEHAGGPAAKRALSVIEDRCRPHPESGTSGRSEVARLRIERLEQRLVGVGERAHALLDELAQQDVVDVDARVA